MAWTDRRPTKDVAAICHPPRWQQSFTLPGIKRWAAGSRAFCRRVERMDTSGLCAARARECAGYLPLQAGRAGSGDRTVSHRRAVRARPALLHTGRTAGVWRAAGEPGGDFLHIGHAGRRGWRAPGSGRRRHFFTGRLCQLGKTGRHGPGPHVRAHRRRRPCLGPVDDPLVHDRQRAALVLALPGSRAPGVHSRA